METTRNENVPRCLSCGLSKDPNNPDLVNVRLGLDEAPEPLMCKCKTDDEIIKGMMTRFARIQKYMGESSKVITSKVCNVELNAAVIRFMSRVPTIEVEARLSSYTAEKMYSCMDKGVFGDAKRDEIMEAGCSAWMRPPVNKNAKLRMRSNGEMVAKMSVHECSIMPGIDIVISYEFDFSGEILRPEYVTVMDQISCTLVIEDVPVTMISRRYECENVVTYASEVEFRAGVTHMQLRRVMNRVVLTVGSERSMTRFIKSMYMDEARHADHDVVDVKDLTPYKGTTMIKADGMKVYVFSYANGYVVTFADRDLTVLSCMVSIRDRPLYEATNRPDILVAEMMVDGSLVYIDTLAVNGEPVPYSREYSRRPVSQSRDTNTLAFEVPPMIVRRAWDGIANMPKSVTSSVPSDGVVCVTGFRTLRLKKPTIDLLHKDGYLYMNENGKMVKVARGHRNMLPNAVYEVSVERSENEGEIVLSRPVRRLIKKMPNNAEIIRRAFMSVSTDLSMSTILYDIQSMSFKMRKRVYDIAQASASVSRRVIVIFGAGRFQELNEMRTSEFSYIAIDPEIDIKTLSRRMKRLAIRPYDVNAPFFKQVQAITNVSGILLYYKGTSESFITMRDVVTKMSEMKIPAVFSFSISYHIRVINTLASMGVGTFGCGYLHENMPVSGVKSGPVSMNVVRDENGLWMVRSTFGRSVWMEPILISSSVAGLHTVRNELPDLWSCVDPATFNIMSRAVIMY